MSDVALRELATSGDLDLDRARASAEALLPEDGYARARSSIRSWPGYAPTPLIPLPGLAARLRVGAISLKDESARFGLGSFKALGGAYAVSTLLATAVFEATGTYPRQDQLVRGEFEEFARRFVVTCTTDGNHGRSVAWGARQVGCQCVIYVHAGVSEARADAIRVQGARVLRVGDTYDESVALNARDAEERGWVVVADTAQTRDAPATLEIMQGYRVMVDEVLEQVDAPPTHVFLQVGCGGFAASAVAHLLGRVRTPLQFVGVEPVSAACLAPSISAGRPQQADGDLGTLMAGLSVGEVSLPAWEILRSATTAVAVVPDASAVRAMRLLSHGIDRDPSVVSGESGAAGLAGLLATAEDDRSRSLLGLDHASRILLFSTEGATDPELYEQIVGDPPQQRLIAQRR